MEFSTNKSIFLQIADNITEKVANGTFSSGEKIPSVREMAAEVGVNPNTIMRTYTELQNLQILENKRGIGFFIKEDAQKLVLEKKKTDFFNIVLPEVMQQAHILGISPDELNQHFEQLNKRNNHENK